MEIARMNYYFTGVLVILFVLLCFMQPAYPKNEYLNEYGVRCGEFETRVEAEDRQTNYNSSSSDYESDNYRLTFSYRKYLGTDCKTSKENVQLKQQLELMKMCNKVNRNPSLAHNENFALLVSKCRGVIPTKAEENRPVEKNTWKGMKKDYLENNPDAKTMDNTTLKMPPKDYILPLPKPKVDE
jgi:hypothetical protein